MMGIIFVDGVSVDANSGQMRVTFASGGEEFRFHLQPHTALKLRETIMRDGWQVLCAQNAEVVPLAPRARKRRA